MSDDELFPDRQADVGRLQGHFSERMSDDELFPDRQAARERSDAAWREFEGWWTLVLWEKDRRVTDVHLSGQADRNPAALAHAEAGLERQYRPMAAEAAETARRRDMPTRLGARVIEGVAGCHLLVLYNNNPDRTHGTARDREREAFRRWLSEEAAEDTRECGYAEHPATGRDEGYTYAMLVLCDPEVVSKVIDQYFALVGTGLPDTDPPAGSEPEG